MNITLTIPDAVATEVIDGICTYTGYAGVGTKADWARAWLLRTVRHTASAGQSKTAYATTKSTLDAASFGVA